MHSPRRYCSRVTSALPRGSLYFFPFIYATGLLSVAPRRPIVAGTSKTLSGLAHVRHQGYCSWVSQDTHPLVKGTIWLVLGERGCCGSCRDLSQYGPREQGHAQLDQCTKGTDPGETLPVSFPHIADCVDLMRIVRKRNRINRHTSER